MIDDVVTLIAQGKVMTVVVPVFWDSNDLVAVEVVRELIDCVAVLMEQEMIDLAAAAVELGKMGTMEVGWGLYDLMVALVLIEDQV